MGRGSRIMRDTGGIKMLTREKLTSMSDENLRNLLDDCGHPDEYTGEEWALIDCEMLRRDETTMPLSRQQAVSIIRSYVGRQDGWDVPASVPELAQLLDAIMARLDPPKR
jgi:hypothetical protein